MNPRSSVADFSKGLSVSLATRLKNASARAMEGAPGPSEILYFMCGARLKGMRSADSMATCFARERAPRV